MTRVALCVALGLGMMAASAKAQQQRPDILTIWDQFSVSNAAASKCVKPDENKLAKFLLNFQIVSTHASLRLKQRFPDWTPARIDQEMKDRYARIDKAVTAVIEQESCDGPKMKEALRRFDAQAGIDFSKSSKAK